MTYRVDISPDDPLALDGAAAARQYLKIRTFVHALIVVVSLGIWLPGMILSLLRIHARSKRFADEYRVRVDRGAIIAGTRDSARIVPLDQVVDVSVRSGVVQVTIRGAQALQLYGLVDPIAAARYLLEERAARLPAAGYLSSDSTRANHQDRDDDAVGQSASRRTGEG